MIAQLYSGSEGNACYIGDENAAILIDCGKTAKALIQGIECLGLGVSSIKGVFITHEHSDHISALRVFSKKYPHIPVYATEGTLAYLQNHESISSSTRLCEIPPGGIEAAGMVITSFATPHDGVDSCGYLIHTKQNYKIGVCTDLGYITPVVEKALIGCDSVVLESNHDIDMLVNGSYHWSLKKRILGQNGHLSNNDCAGFAARLLLSGCHSFALAHLSKDNNSPELAFAETRAKLESTGAQCGKDFVLEIAPRSQASILFNI